MGGGRCTGQGVVAAPATENKNLKLNLSISKVKLRDVDLTVESKSENLLTFNSFKEKQLLNLRNKHMKDDNRTDSVFIKQCKFHCHQQIDKGLTEDKVFFGLVKLIQQGRFSCPHGFVNVENQSHFKAEMKKHEEIKQEAKVNSNTPLETLQKTAIERFHSIPGIDRIIIKKYLEVVKNGQETPPDEFIASQIRILDMHQPLINELRQLKQFG